MMSAVDSVAIATQPQQCSPSHVATAPCVQGAYVNMTADAALLEASRPHVDELLAALPADAAASGEPWATTLARTSEALLVPTQVRRCGL